MEIYEMEAHVRDRTGKGVARKLRARGYIPAVCYHKGADSIPLSLDGRRLQKIMNQGGGRNILIRLNIDDHGDWKQKTVMLKEVQKDLRQNILHIDLLEILMDETVVVEVPIRLIGEPSDIVRAGANIQIVKRELEIECLPSKIPEYIDIDISNLNIGDTIHVEDIRIDADIKLLTDLKEPIIVVMASEGAEEEKAEEEEEVAEEEKKTEDVKEKSPKTT